MLIFRRREYGIKRRVRAPERERERRAMKVELTIPDNRAGSEQWIQGQSTEVVVVTWGKMPRAQGAGVRKALCFGG